ncbi:MAG: class I SAM-dependent methyltransferase [Patescibacteria group bacterium]
MNHLTSQFIELLPPNSTVVDLGSGPGIYAKKLLDLGHQVIAVDKKIVLDIPGIDFRHQSVQDFIINLPPDFKADGWLLKNVIQFIDKKYVLNTLIPTIKNHTNPNGIIAVETFFKDPEPAFDHPFTSYYHLTDLTPLLLDWDIQYLKEEVSENKDMNGTIRSFAIISLLVRKT